MAKKALPKHADFNGALAVFDEAVVRAALALTDASITTEEEAYELFIDVARGRERLSFGDDRFKSSIEGPHFATWDWGGGQRLMRKWLPDVARFDSLPGRKAAALLHEISEISEASGHSLRMRIGLKGLEWAVEQDSIGNCCCRAVMPFIMPRGWSPRRIGKCQYQKCGKWFLRPEPKRGSVPLYCSKNCANSARVNAYRQRRKETDQ